MKKSLVMISLLALALILGLSSSSLAADKNYDDNIINGINIESPDEEIMPLRYTIINTIGAALTLDNGIAKCLGDVSTQETVYKIEVSMILQKYSGGKWTTWASWYDYAYNTNEFSIERSAPYGSGSYRVYVTATVTAYDGSDEEQSINSVTKP